MHETFFLVEYVLPIMLEVMLPMVSSLEQFLQLLVVQTLYVGAVFGGEGFCGQLWDGVRDVQRMVICARSDEQISEIGWFLKPCCEGSLV